MSTLQLDTLMDMDMDEAVAFLKRQNYNELCATVILYHKINLATKGFLEQAKDSVKTNVLSS